MKNSRLGAIGEQMAIVKLMQMGWDAFNLNNLESNYKSADLACINPETGKAVTIQVKTGSTNNIMTGFVSDNKGHIKQDIRKLVIGPWIFIKANGEGVDMTFDFYILTRDEVIELVETSNDWYINGYKRDNELGDVYIGLKTNWLEGDGEIDNTDKNYKKTHIAYVSPLKETSKDKWEKIWE